MTSLMQDIWELKSWHDAGRRTNAPKSERRRKDVYTEESGASGRLQAEYIPSLEEIQAACLEIQQEWSEAERRRRSGSRGRRSGMQVIRLVHVEEAY